MAANHEPWWKNQKVLGLAAVGLFAGFAMVVVTAKRPLSPLEQVLFSIVTVFIGVWASFVAGHQSGQEAAEQRLRAQARYAFRRVLTLYGGHGRTVALIEDRIAQLKTLGKDGHVTLEQAVNAFQLVEAQVIEQGFHANDSVEDWRDLAPDEIAALERVLQQKLGQED